MLLCSFSVVRLLMARYVMLRSCVQKQLANVGVFQCACCAQEHVLPKCSTQHVHTKNALSQLQQLQLQLLLVADCLPLMCLLWRVVPRLCPCATLIVDCVCVCSCGTAAATTTTTTTATATAATTSCGQLLLLQLQLQLQLQTANTGLRTSANIWGE